MDPVDPIPPPLTWPLRISERPEPVHLVLGAFDLWVQPAPHVGSGVRILHWRSTGDPERPASIRTEGVVVPEPPPRLPGDAPEAMRTTTAGPIRIAPRVPPLSVVARPEMPVWLGVGETLRAYVGVPAWVTLDVGATHPDGVGVPELPLQALQRTWVGTPTEGSLCLATRTHLRLSVDRLQHTAHRIACPVVLRNSGTEALTIERLVLPLPAARLYTAVDPTGNAALWSETLVIDHTRDGPVARADGPPDEAQAHGAVTQVAEARENVPRGLSGVVSAVLQGFVG